jgi:AraC family ethanolamine operon transcriptional activator
MQAHLHDPMGVPEICAAAYASRRSLQYCFEELMHTTPQAYLRALRLNQARRVLKQADTPAIVDVACDLGFANASHFTRHYKTMFGELPSQTLKASGADRRVRGKALSA